jgi:hypothetical protein
MQETLAQEWQKRMAARSGLVALLLSIPVLTAVVIGFSGGIGGLPLGISSLATGPDDSALRATPSGAFDLSSAAGAPAAGTATAAGGGASPGADAGTSPGAAGATPVGIVPVVPGDSGGGGGGGGGGEPSRGPEPAPVPPPPPAPAPVIEVPVDPTGGTVNETVNGAVTQVQSTVDGVLQQVP